MAVTAKMYGKAIMKALNKEVNWTSDTIKVALLANSYTPDQDIHDYWDDVSANEASGTGYVAGGTTLTTKTMTYDTANNKIKLDADDVTWASSTITARYAVIYVNTGTPSTSAVLGYVDFGADQSSSNGNFIITWNASGIFEITVS